METADVTPEMIEKVKLVLAQQGLCKQTNLSYLENRLVLCTLHEDHVREGVDHQGVEADGKVRGWDL